MRPLWAQQAGLRLTTGDGQAPTKRVLRRFQPGVFGLTASGNLHPNPRFYKYIWWIYAEPEAVDDRLDVRRRTPDWALPIASAMQWLTAMDRAEVRYMVNWGRVRRDDPALPWDFGRLRREDYAFAPSFDDDPDPLWNGHR